MNTKYKRGTQAVAAFALCILFASGAEAGGVKLRWDPQFQLSGTYQGLGFRGTADFTIDDVCLAAQTAPTWVQASGCTTMTFDGATLDLYDATLGPSAPTLETLIYNDPPNSVIGMAIDDFGLGNQVIGVDTHLLGPQQANNSAFTGWVWLWLDSNTCTNNFDTCPPNGITPPELISGRPYGMPAAFISLGVANDACSEDGIVFCDPIGNDESALSQAADVTIPEPGTIGLILGALGAGWFTRRRRVAA